LLGVPKKWLSASTPVFDERLDLDATTPSPRERGEGVVLLDLVPITSSERAGARQDW